MSEIERLKPKHAEELSSIVRGFSTQGRALVQAVNQQAEKESSISEWYSDFCSDADNRFGTILYMYAKGVKGIRRTVVLGSNFADRNGNKTYSPRHWSTNDLDYDIWQMRKGRRGSSAGAEITVARYADLSTATLGHIKFVDTIPSGLEVHWFNNPYASLVLGSEGAKETRIFGNFSATAALSKTVSAIESMPGIISPTSELPAIETVEVPHLELPPFFD